VDQAFGTHGEATLMTYSLLARDPDSGDFAAAAATGSLCVGAWVLRGDPRYGLSATQGELASTLWGEAALQAMAAGARAPAAVAAVVGADRGRAWRQLAALDAGGWTGQYTGAANQPWRGGRALADLVVTGNRLGGPAVLDALLAAWQGARGALLAERLLAALEAAERAGGDRNGLQSAALLIVSRRHAPLSLRVDAARRPLRALRALYARSCEPGYAAWFGRVPCLDHPERPQSPGTGVLP
jgi:uncharacterized Ntn-hydrolase superfamily protein